MPFPFLPQAPITAPRRTLPGCLLLLLGLGLLVPQMVLAAVPDLSISGAMKKEEANIRALLRVDTLECHPAEWRYRLLRKHIISSTKKALRALGYYHPKIELKIISDVPADSCIKIKLKVDQGVGVMVQKVTIKVSGGLEKTKAFADFMYQLPLSEGRILEHNKYEETRNGIEQVAERLGYFDGKFITHKLEVNTDTNDAWMTLVYESGPRYQLGRIDIEQTVFDLDLINQFTILRRTQPYDTALLLEQQQILSDSGLFDDIEVIARRDQRDEKTLSVPVTVRLKERKRTAHRFGIGASTDLGPRISYRMDRRWINRRGHTGGFDATLSPNSRKATARYSIPLEDYGQTRFDFQTGYQRELTETTDSSSYKLSASKTRLLDKKWTRTLALEFLRENFITGDVEDTTDLLMPGIRWNKILVDNALFPRDGWRLRARLRGAVQGVLSDTHLSQLVLGVKFIKPLGAGRVLSRVKVGATEVGDFDLLPSSLRFYAGGDGSIRGYDYKALGPVDNEGTVVGGQFLSLASLEYEHPLNERFGVAVFSDTGSAFDSRSDFELHTGLGMGLRWHSPLGPIRLDIARNMDNGGYRLHLSMGPDL